MFGQSINVWRASDVDGIGSGIRRGLDWIGFYGV